DAQQRLGSSMAVGDSNEARENGFMSYREARSLRNRPLFVVALQIVTSVERERVFKVLRLFTARELDERISIQFGLRVPPDNGSVGTEIVVRIESGISYRPSDRPNCGAQ